MSARLGAVAFSALAMQAPLALCWCPAAGAQGLPALPPPAEPAAPPASPAPGPPPPPPPPVEVSPPPAPPPPPRVVFIEPPPPVHAPRFSFWVGGRLGLLAYSGGLYINNANTGAVETTGNFVKPGLGLEIDAGARIEKRFIPYVGLEMGLVGAGHRFEGATTPTTAGTRFYAAGLRYLAGDVDGVSFASDLSFGFREFYVNSDSQTFTLSGLEIFRLGLGLEIRIDKLFALSPILTLSGGSLTQRTGSVAFAPGQGDGMAGPPFAGNGNIPGWAMTTYYAIFFGCGASFDFFGQ